MRIKYGTNNKVEAYAMLIAIRITQNAGVKNIHLEGGFIYYNSSH